ncbi:hypothetical protein [Alteribacillus sp. YIM 98480]|uniref:hypothetical protein n=1 Tax=Alteribacillus sp. YIM 98480 TaxID=2606599 RepID=UPI00131A9484|nr:hypothetical protein [Alteribacillus sp. YIM 98480]
MNECKQMTVWALAFTSDMQMIDTARNGNEGECTGEEGNCGCTHPEKNLISTMTIQDLERTETVLLTHSPCETCAFELYYNMKLQHVFYKEEYRKTDGIEFLQLKGIETRKVDWTKWPIEQERVTG